MGGGHQPSMGGHQSSMGGHQPSMGGHQPTMGGHQPSMGGSSTNYGGSSAKYGGGHQPSMGGSSTNYGGGHQPSMGGCIFPPVCTGNQNPENYFSNTYVLPSVNRTAGPINIVGSKGAPGTRAPSGSKFFHFHAVFRKKNGKTIG